MRIFQVQEPHDQDFQNSQIQILETVEKKNSPHPLDVEKAS